jgi:hypothetical protein
VKALRRLRVRAYKFDLWTRNLTGSLNWRLWHLDVAPIRALHRLNTRLVNLDRGIDRMLMRTARFFLPTATFEQMGRRHLERTAWLQTKAARRRNRYRRIRRY